MSFSYISDPADAQSMLADTYTVEALFQLDTYDLAPRTAILECWYLRCVRMTFIYFHLNLQTVDTKA